MKVNLTGRQILLIILGIIVLIWLISWLTSSKKITIATQQPFTLSGSPQQQQLKAQFLPRPTQPPTQSPTRSPSLNQEQAYILYYFFSPKCGHCINFSPTWNALASRLQNTQGLSTRAVDSTNPENENLVFYYNITGFPTILLITPSGKVEYTGNRSENDLLEFLRTNIQ